MLLHNFLKDYEEEQAKRLVQDFVGRDPQGRETAEFLGHFLSSKFQPVFKLRNSQLEVVAFEAFVRPVAGSGMLSPLDYFGSLNLEDASFVDSLCNRLHVSNFLAGSLPHEIISLNVDPRSLEAHIEKFADLQEHIALAGEFGLSPNRIMVELDITPSIDAGVLYTFSQMLKEQGIKICLSGFDADNASFNRILQNKPNVLSFNRSWLSYGMVSVDFRHLISDVIQRIHSFGITSHFERIEDQTDLNFALACGFTSFQGYFLGKPASDLIRTPIDLASEFRQ